jgi:5-methyltetrahydrofolate--homocysteine methyltransferase
MPDLQLRFHKDMLVLSSPIEASLAAQGIEAAAEGEALSITESEMVREVLQLESLSGAPCLVTPTNGITRARLAHARLEDRDAQIADAALDIVESLSPQHIIAEIGPTRLPIDPESKTSLMANRDQYGEAVRAFGTERPDAFFLNGLAGIDDLRCALMGVRRMCDTPVLASVDVDASGNAIGRSQSIEAIIDVMEDFEADVVGFATSAPVDCAAAIVERICRATELPILVQLEVGRAGAGSPAADSPYSHPDTLIDAALRLRAAGAQFLRASGAAAPAYTGALVAAVSGADSIR